jgi:hypothetical protein
MPPRNSRPTAEKPFEELNRTELVALASALEYEHLPRVLVGELRDQLRPVVQLKRTKGMELPQFQAIFPAIDTDMGPCRVAQHYTLLTPKSDQTQRLLEIDIGL